jgi:uncharacterized repeat protein (TIGR03803 family)
MNMKKLLFILIIGLFPESNLVMAQYSKLLDFNGTAKGSYPRGNMTLSEDEVLYGMTADGGDNDLGCIFKINANGTGYSKLFDFSGSSDGSNPGGSLTLSGDMLYGVTIYGGNFNWGCIFTIGINGSGFDKLFNFNGSSGGSSPFGSMTLSGNLLYGMTEAGGTNNKGCIFCINTGTSVYTKLFDFSGTADGSYPCGDLIISGNVMYGMTSRGGANDLGCIFKINTNGSGYTQLLDFDGTDNGSKPFGSLTLSDGVLYGMTNKGGANSLGCIFSINTDGTDYNRLLDFDGSGNGSEPYGSLLIIGNDLYGMAFYGGANDLGCMFKFDPLHNRYYKLVDFNGANGSMPKGDLTYSSSALYGTTEYGGTYDVGVLFKYYLKPYEQTSHITFPFVGFNFADINWTNGNGEKRAVFLKEGTGTITDPDDNATYTASSDWNTKGSQLGTSGYYCIYNGSGNIVTITNLSPGATYTVQVFEYNGESGIEQYFLNTETGNPNSFQTTTLTALVQVDESPVRIYSDGTVIYAEINQSDPKTQLAVFNLSGVYIARISGLAEGQNIIAGNFQPGVYLVTWILGDKKWTQKVVIEK